MRFKELMKYRKLVQDPIQLDTADLDIRSMPKYKNFKEARIVR